MTRTRCNVRSPLVETALAPPSIRVRETETPSLKHFTDEENTVWALAVLTMGTERKSRGFDSH